MDRCPRCSKIVEPNWAYCPVCDRPRILESLRTPVVQPAWQQPLWQAAAALVTLWLIVTLGVAFLREAKAVRVSRELLDAGKTQDAWSILQPFLPDHKNHSQALFLCGQEAIQLHLGDEAKQCLQGLEGLSPDLAKELRADYGRTLTAGTVGCNADSFGQLLALGDQLGSDFAGTVLSKLGDVVETCRAARDYYTPMRITQMLARSGREMAMIEQGYVPAISKAVAQGRRADAEVLARQAGRMIPAGSAAVSAALGPAQPKSAQK